MAYTVIDFETTGFSKTDRIIEVGAVIIDETGKLVTNRPNTFDTLVNPLRDISNSHVHHITARDTFLAPTFEEIAEQLSIFMNGTVLVAHNREFELKFLTQEYERVGLNVPIQLKDMICTMKLGRNKNLGGSLHNMLEQQGLSATDAHRALMDAQATGALLTSLNLRTKRWFRPWDSRTLYGQSTKPSQSMLLSRDDVETELISKGIIPTTLKQHLNLHTVADLKLTPGSRIAFTGSPEKAAISKSDLETQAKANGFFVMDSVTPKTDALIAFDPYSFSGKMVKARGQNVPIVVVEDWISQFSD